MEEFYFFEDLVQGRIVAFHNQLLAVAEMLANEDIFLFRGSHRQVVVLGIPADGARTVGHREEFQTVAGEEHIDEVLALFLTLGAHFVKQRFPFAVIEKESAEYLLGSQSFVSGFPREFCGKILGKCL